MHPALIELNKLRLRATVRRSIRGLKSPRGVLLSLFGLAVIGFMVVPNLAMAFVLPRAKPETLQTLLPLLLFGLVVVGLLGAPGQKAVTFSMAEVAFLFPGPFTRRELLLYKLFESGFAALLTSLVFSALMLRWSTWWIASFVGIWLTFLFIQLLNMSLVFSMQWAGEQAFARTRRLILFGILAVAAIGLWQVQPVGAEFQWSELPAWFRGGWAGSILLAPFEVFSRAITAQSLVPEFLLWAGAALVIDLGLVALVLRLDANYLEAAAQASEKRYELVSRARRGQLPAMGTQLTRRWRVRQFPWIGGAGPIAWRQSLQIVRGSSRFLLVLMIFGVIMIGPAMLRVGPKDQVMAIPAVIMVVYLSLFFPMIVPSGFRADLDYMDWLKMLPLSPLALVTGEMLPATLFISLLQGLALASMTPLGIVSPMLAFVVASFTLPVNLLFLAVDNLVFLYYPSRIVQTSPGDFQFMGRNMLMMFLRLLVVLAACAIAGAVVGVAWLTGIESPIAVGIVGWVMLLIEGIATMFLAVHAFRRFDPSVDTPA